MTFDNAFQLIVRIPLYSCQDMHYIMFKNLFVRSVLLRVKYTNCIDFFVYTDTNLYN